MKDTALLVGLLLIMAVVLLTLKGVDLTREKEKAEEKTRDYIEFLNKKREDSILLEEHRQEIDKFRGKTIVIDGEVLTIDSSLNIIRNERSSNRTAK